VDVPVWGRRERDVRNAFRLPDGMLIESMLMPGHESFYDGDFGPSFSDFINARFKFDLSWHDLDWLRTLSDVRRGCVPKIVDGGI
jgi:FMN-dependent dehydrogenase